MNTTAKRRTTGKKSWLHLFQVSLYSRSVSTKLFWFLFIKGSPPRHIVCVFFGWPKLWYFEFYILILAAFKADNNYDYEALLFITVRIHFIRLDASSWYFCGSGTCSQFTPGAIGRLQILLCPIKCLLSYLSMNYINVLWTATPLNSREEKFEPLANGKVCWEYNIACHGYWFACISFCSLIFTFCKHYINRFFFILKRLHLDLTFRIIIIPQYL